jgi:hypothetical protein
LTVAFQLPVEFDSEDARLTRLQPFRGFQVRPTELGVVVPLARRPRPCSVNATARSCSFSGTRWMSPWSSKPNVERLVRRIAHVALTHPSKRADCRQRARVRSVERVVAIAVVDQLALRPTQHCRNSVVSLCHTRDSKQIERSSPAALHCNRRALFGDRVRRILVIRRWKRRDSRFQLCDPASQ